MHNSSQKISASEINRFDYCPYQWYYERKYGTGYIREKLSRVQKTKHKSISSTSAKSIKNAENRFARGNQFHRSYRKVYMQKLMFKRVFMISIVVLFISTAIFFREHIFIAIILFLILIIIINSRTIKKTNAKFPSFPYRLFYTDEKNFKDKRVICSKVLFDKKYNITGKPDWIYKNIFTGSLIPIELKSGTIGLSDKPRHGDLLQLVSYFIILKDCFKTKPHYGFLIYADCMFVIRNKKKLRNEVFLSIKKMRAMLRSGHCVHKKNQLACKSCLCSAVCKI